MRLTSSLLIALFCLGPAGLRPAVYDVGANTTFATFGAAFDQMALDAGGIPATTTITVHARTGTYFETVQPPIISQPLHILGFYGEDPLILSGASYGVRVSGVANVTIERLLVRNSGSAGISIENCPGARILWNRLQNNGGAEIQVQYSPGTQVWDNQLKPQSGSGLVLQFSPNSLARANTVSRFGASNYSSALVFSDSPSSEIISNTAFDALTGFGVYSSQGTTLSANAAFSRNGIAGSKGAYFSSSAGCAVRNNLLVGQPRGFEIQSSPSCAVQNNTIWEHGTVGLLASLSSPLELANNIIQGYTALDFDSSTQAGLTSNFNTLSGDNRVAVGTATYTLLSNWQSTGNDLASVSANPVFLNAAGSSPTDFQIGAGSPARQSGADLSAFYTRDYFDNQQDLPWDMGFHAASGIQATPTPTMTPSPIVPSATVSPTQTPTISPTHSATPPNSPTTTRTISATLTVSATLSATPYPIRREKLTSYPNPYEPSKGGLNFTFDPSDEASLKIFDVAGHLIAELAPAAVKPTEGYASWDGRESSGRPLPSGLYFAVLRSSKGNRFTRFTILHP